MRLMGCESIPLKALAGRTEEQVARNISSCYCRVFQTLLVRIAYVGSEATVPRSIRC